MGGDKTTGIINNCTFEENFAEFQAVYGRGPYMQDMYSAGFYPFPDQESKWGYWSRQALLAGIDLDVTPLHRTLIDALKGKRTFILSTNADRQFEKAGYPAGSLPRRARMTASSANEAAIPGLTMRRICSGRWNANGKTRRSPRSWYPNVRSAAGIWR